MLTAQGPWGQQAWPPPAARHQPSSHEAAWALAAQPHYHPQPQQAGWAAAGVPAPPAAWPAAAASVPPHAAHPSAGGSKPLAASAAAEFNARRQLNNRLRRATSAEDLFAAIAEQWESVDCINLSSAFYRLGQLGDADPGGPAAFARARRQGHPCWHWLMDQLPDALRCPDFGPQAVVNTLKALVKLDALTPFLLRALEGPLLRALASAHSRSSHFLTQLLWAFGHEQAARPLLLAVAPQLLGAMAAAAPNLDGQAISTAWWALGELTAAGTQRPQEEALHLASLAPDLLPRLAVAARAAAGTLTFQGISQVLHACTKMRPQFQDKALVQVLLTATSRRLGAGEERPTPQAISLIVQALARMGCAPACHWCPLRGQQVNVLDDLGAALVAQLHAAQPQARLLLTASWPQRSEVCGYVSGLGQLDYAPSPTTLRALLAHLAAPTGGEAAAAPAAPNAQEEVEEGGRGPGQRRSLVLEAFSCQMLTDIVCALRRIIQPRRYPESQLPPAVLSAFFDSFDTVLGGRAGMAPKLGASPKLRAEPLRAELELTPQHVGGVCWALAGIPGASLSADTLRLLERHLVVFSGGYNASGIANLLECYCTHRLQLGQPAAEAVCERVLAILQQPQPQPGQTAFSFGALARVLAAVAALPLHLPRLLPPLLHALRCALAAPERLLDPSGCLPPRFSEHLIFAMVALGQLQAGGLLAPAGLASAEAVLPLWRLLVDWASVAADGAGAGAAGHAVSPDSDRREQWAAMQLNQGLAGGQAAFQLPPAVLRVLGPPAARWGVQEQQQYM